VEVVEDGLAGGRGVEAAEAFVVDQVTSNRQQATSYRLQATGNR
jgi:hypothetical protein